MNYITNIDNTKFEKYDVIIVGSGIAGLFTALSLPAHFSVALMTKLTLSENNSNLAQGGIAVTFAAEDFQSHIEDTIMAGQGYNDRKAVKVLVEEGAQAVNDLIQFGASFDMENGHLLFTKEGAHQRRRVIHHKDITGEEIIRALVDRVKKQENIKIFDHSFVADLLEDQGKIVGVSYLYNEEVRYLHAPSVVLATGGIGKLFMTSTNSIVSAGDGIAMAYRKGGAVKDMEFIQFHPTPIDMKGQCFLISEAVRGEGGILRNEAGEAFMERYHPLKDLAPRDIVARAIFNEMKARDQACMYLDVTHLGSFFAKRFPNINAFCIDHGIDPSKDHIPISPAEHYVMGGLVTNLNGQTNLPGLYACGEVARTGVHGANRLASNSLLEGLVFAKRVAKHIKENYQPLEKVPYIKHDDLVFTEEDHWEDLIKIRKLMSKEAYIVRSEKGLEHALMEIKEVLNKHAGLTSMDPQYLEMKNILTVAKLVVEAALNRKGSLGSHYMRREE